MLAKITTIIFLLISIQNFTAQSGEIGLNIQYGIASNRLRADYNSQDKFSQGKNGTVTGSNWLNDKVFGFEYKHQFIKRWKLFWNFGYEYGVFKRFNNITQGTIIYDVVKYKTKRSEYHIGLFKRFELKKSKINFDCGFDLSYRKYRFSHSGSSSQSYQPYNTDVFIEYEYDKFSKDLGFGYSYTPKILNLELQAKANFPLSKNIYLNAGLRFSFNYFEFQYVNYQINHYDDDGNFLYYYQLTSAGAPKLTVGNYLNFTLGISYKFNWENIHLKKKKD